MDEYVCASSRHFECFCTTGVAFAGVVGNRVRREYSVLGDIVNVSARLMQHAGAWGHCE